jgi:hypothetical protein
MILPDIEDGALHIGWRVTAFSDLKSENSLTMAALITREADHNGVICLTFTA